MPPTPVLAVLLAAAVLLALTVIYTRLETASHDRRASRDTFLATPERLAAVGARRPTAPVAPAREAEPFFGDLLRQGLVATLLFVCFVAVLTFVEASAPAGGVQGRTSAPSTPSATTDPSEQPSGSLQPSTAP